jgi:hypothetical protein
MSTFNCYECIFCLLHYVHILLPTFIFVMLCPHFSIILCLSHTVPTSHYHLFSSIIPHITTVFFSNSHYVHTSVPCSGSLTLRPPLSTMFWLSHIMSTPQCHVLALSHYVHTLVPCSGSLTLHPHLSTMFWLSHITSTTQYNVLALSHYVHTSGPCSGSVTLCLQLTTIFHLSHIMFMPHYDIFLSHFMSTSIIFCLFQMCIKGKILYQSTKSTNSVCLNFNFLKPVLPFQVYTFVNKSYT